MRLVLIAVGILFCASARAHLVTYKNGISFMSMVDQEIGMYTLGYTFHRNFSVSLEHFNWLDANGDTERRTVGQINALIKRWNRPDSQANIYAGIGYGEQETTSYQVEVDWEDREYYTLAEYRALQSSIASDAEIFRARLGLAPYVANAGGLHSWLIFEYLKNDLMRNQESLTPFLRFFHQNVLIELGYSFDREFKFGFMIHL